MGILEDNGNVPALSASFGTADNKDCEEQDKEEEVKKEDEQTEEEGLLCDIFDESQCVSEIIKRDSVLQFTEELVVKRVYLLGRVIANIFHEAGLPYWATGGTALGIERHKGLIPWDDDLDLCVQDTHEDQLLSLAPTLLRSGVELHEAFSGYRLFHATESVLIDGPVQKYKRRFPFCDVFIMRKGKRKRLELRNDASRTCWEDEWYKIDEVEPRQPRLFGNFHIMCANNHLPYLERTYGPDCLEVGLTQYYSHSDSQAFSQPKQVCLETVGFEPAKPFE